MARGEPRIRVTAVEATLGTRFTAETLGKLTARRPGVRFVWIMGADNLRQFHRWRQWREIASMMPIAVFDRPGSTYAAARPRRPRRRSLGTGSARSALRSLPASSPPAWAFLHGRRTALSSTACGRGKVADRMNLILTQSTS